MGKLAFALLLVMLAEVALAGEVVLPSGEKAAIKQLENGTPYAVLADGTKLLGVDMGWYAKAEPDPQPLSEDDRAAIQEILTVPSFYDKVESLLLTGDAQRAVALVQLLRNRDFHAGSGELIWRIELWYFEFQNGGWAKVSQQNKLLDRQRFKSADEYKSYVSKVAYAPKLRMGGSEETITLSVADVVRPK